MNAPTAAPAESTEIRDMREMVELFEKLGNVEKTAEYQARLDALLNETE